MTTKIFPQVRKSSLGKVGLSKERQWMQQHSHEYRGQWVVLGDGRLIGHTDIPEEVKAIVEKARAEGITVPYVKLVNNDSETIWMGWLYAPDSSVSLIV